ncbi:large subunit ribosomal protein L23 [Methanobrevibacter gottschalkii]|uniref:Large ribosomal subunit protein uL23 n=2 Tax=Methanobrevibacter gottschalkii TaxID=190974 RepID=A0A3N5B808_9EURY|nr:MULTISPECIES: 50S ribosomal protein L23 [Methanobrevibacter]MCQ2970723.1 50S ribosomal protein L23 [archaeon]OEC97065.1 50S ribosomal protein L23 [Methanobrevibacter sp. A27]RPF51620.1 LSU ribosomal protein L23P [Methanobrevibacter gottschalkii DSM 11977]SEL25882.1 large subunit ribosomal protein L23 [Methanobrevibacter gottschalkii]
MNAYSIIIKPHVTEKTMNLIDQNNVITFVVNRESNKSQIKRAFEELYEEKVAKVNTHITTKGVKVAYIKLVEEEMAEELAVRIGVF